MLKTMTATQFCYWLQGWLETMEPVTISQSQTENIKHRLSTVTQGNNFCNQLNGFFLMTAVIELDETHTSRLKNMLKECFIQEIDKRYSEREHQEMDRLHNFIIETKSENLSIEEIHARRQNNLSGEMVPTMYGARPKC